MPRIVDVVVEPLSVPLVEPFVIASGRMERTRAVLVEVVVEGPLGDRGRGLGEAAALPPVTACDQPELMAALSSAATSLRGASFSGLRGLRDVIDGVVVAGGVVGGVDGVDGVGGVGGARLDPVARSGLESALLFAWADLLGVPMHRLLGSSPKDDPVRPFAVDTDITIPIGEPLHMASLVVDWAERGFRVFKVKVGRSEADGGESGDVDAIDAIATVAPGARLRLDGNAGQTEQQARALFHRCLEQGLTVELLEQPTPKDQPLQLASLSTSLPVPVIADESAGSYDDVKALAAVGVSSVNLKLVKHGGPLEAARIGRLARRRGLALMAGAMVETRVGLAAMFHVVRAIALQPDGLQAGSGVRAKSGARRGGGIAIDLDTAFLLSADPFTGGYDVDGPRLTLRDDGPRRR